MAFVARAAGKQQKIHSFAPLYYTQGEMEGNILKRDRQQFQMNQELDLRTRLLMREAECIKKESAIAKPESKLAAEICSNIFIPKESIGFDSKFTGVEYDDKLLTVPSSTPSFEPELRFLRAKVKILTGEIDKQKDDQKKRSEEIKALDNELHVVKEERTKFSQQLGAAEQKISKMTMTLDKQSNSLKILESVKSRLTNELQAAKKEAKASTQSASTMELRMNRALEEIESLRSTLQNQRGQEKDEHESQRKVIESQNSLIQKLERQQAELILAFRRQMMLCHNLLRQKELISRATTLNSADAKFSQMLEGKGENK